MSPKFKEGDYIIAKVGNESPLTGRIMRVDYGNVRTVRDPTVYSSQMGYMIQVDDRELDQRWVLEVELEFDVLKQMAAI